MDAYIYNADLYCKSCGEAIRKRLTKEGFAPADPDDEYSYDSDEFPKGPIAKGGGESDIPHHCGSGHDCLEPLIIDDEKYGCFLENPLTSDGYEYLKKCLRDDPDTPFVQLWSEFYDIEPEDDEVIMEDDD